MAIRDVVEDGAEILRKKARAVTAFDDKLGKILDDMVETMGVKEGVGLAAPQIGYLRRFAVFMLEDGEIVELINPVVLEAHGEEVLEEGCLSVPQRCEKIKRPIYLRVKYQDRHGNELERVFEGYDARVCCHEMDHLDGILYYDKAIADDEEE